MKLLNVNGYVLSNVDLYNSGNIKYLPIDDGVSDTKMALTAGTSEATRLQYFVYINGGTAGATYTCRLFLGDTTYRYFVLDEQILVSCDNALLNVSPKTTKFYKLSSVIGATTVSTGVKQLWFSLNSNNAADTSVTTVCIYIYDVDKNLDVLTIGGTTPITANDVADAILADAGGGTRYPIATHPDGSVKTKGGLAR